MWLLICFESPVMGVLSPAGTGPWRLRLALAAGMAHSTTTFPGLSIQALTRWSTAAHLLSNLTKHISCVRATPFPDLLFRGPQASLDLGNEPQAAFLNTKSP